MTYPPLNPNEARAPWRGPRRGDGEEAFVIRDPAAIEEGVLCFPVRWAAGTNPTVEVMLDTPHGVQPQQLPTGSDWHPVVLPPLPSGATGHLLLTGMGWRPYHGTTYGEEHALRSLLPMLAPREMQALHTRPTHGHTRQDLQILVDALTKQRPQVLQRAYLPGLVGTTQSAQRPPTRTLQPAPASLCFAFASCQYPAGVLDELPARASLQRLAARCTQQATSEPPLQCVLLMGDQIYADASYGLLDPTRLDDRFSAAYANWLGMAPLREIMLSVPVHCMLDDHELEDNWEPTACSPTWEDDLTQEGIEAFQRHQRTSPVGSQRSPLWGTVRLRSDHEAFVLDTRTGRDPRPWPATSQPSVHILGEDQRDALESWLPSVAAGHPRWIVSPVWLLPRPVGTPDSQGQPQPMIPALCDAWPGYPDSLHWLLGLIAGQRIENVVMLCGDAHLAGHTVLTLTTGVQKPVRVDLLHCPALYAPFPFANARPWQFLLEDTIFGSQGNTKWCCKVKSTVWHQGDGFVSVRFDPSEGSNRITATFDTTPPRTVQIP